ncbi:MAG: hypothetical protein HZC17_02005 [Candidatus Omnitrophica bacterium]|nr:hypothetical protein [Candidatus Omnitrophota bacterium]
MKKIIYAGDSPVGGAANYLLAILNSLKISYTHVPPEKILKSGRFDAIILSDFSKKNLPADSERKIVDQVERGAGLLMIGGWGSFSGPVGRWRGSQVEKLLPVQCLNRDDRTNFPGGALIALKQKHAMFDGLSFTNPPVICGMNQVRVKKSGRVILTAKKLVNSVYYPLLVVDANPAKRIAALTTDLAPHWCGGMVDWGKRSVWLPVNSKTSVEVGDSYIRFVSSLVRWLVKERV